MTQIKREPTCYSVIVDNTKIESFGIDFYGEDIAEKMAKSFAKGWDASSFYKKLKDNMIWRHENK
jgi:hypothetical protein